MVIAAGIALMRVFNPTIIRIGASTSPITAKMSDGCEPIPNGSEKRVLPSINFSSFGMPWVSIAALGTTRNSKRPMFRKREVFRFMLRNYRLKE